MKTWGEKMQEKTTNKLQGIMTYDVFKRAANALATSTTIFSEHLFSDEAGKTIEELKTQRSKSGQLLPGAQKEMSLRGQKMRFLELHRYMFSLKLTDLECMFAGMRRLTVDMHDDKYVYSDQLIMKDLIDFHICFRDDKYFDLALLDDLAASFYKNIRIYEKLKERVIDSHHMIKLAEALKNAGKDYTFECSTEGLGRKNTIFVTNIQTHFDGQALDMMPKIREAINKAEAFEANQMRCSAIDQICNFSVRFGKCLADMNPKEIDKASNEMLEGFAFNEWVAA